MENNILENVDLKKYNTYGVGGIAKFFYLPSNSFELLEKITELKENNIPYFVIGLGSNIILPDENFEGYVISLKKFNELNIDDNILTIGAGISLPFLNASILKKGFVNFVWAAGIPGNIGGSIYGNAGAYKHDIFENLISIDVLIDDEIKTLNKEDIKYGYRHTSLTNEIILSAKFELIKGDIEAATNEMNENLEKRKSSQPIELKNAGSVFRNPEGNYAGKLIEELGLKGYKVGGAMVSEKHANFIINFDSAKSSDIKNLICEIKTEVKNKHDIELIVENKIISWDQL